MCPHTTMCPHITNTTTTTTTHTHRVGDRKGRILRHLRRDAQGEKKKKGKTLLSLSPTACFTALLLEHALTSEREFYAISRRDSQGFRFSQVLRNKRTRILRNIQAISRYSRRA